MNHSLDFKHCLMKFLSCILLLLTVSGLESATIPTFANETDQLALLDLKSRITEDPLGIMNSWNDSLHFCNWIGITCSPSNGRVVILNLSSQRLAGSVPPSIGNLTFLTGLNLRNNGFHGELPQELGRLVHLQRLNLTLNSFTGVIPTNLTHCTELRFLFMNRNKLVGPVPDQLSSLSKLLDLRLSNNNLTGRFPAWIGNFSSLVVLSLGDNNLHGSIPRELGYLSRLGFLSIGQNELSGTIPASIFNISSIYVFSVTQNQLRGQFPPNLGLMFPNLQIFAGGVNGFTGHIPVSIPNASFLEVIDFDTNGFTGPVPPNLGRLQSLYRFNFDNNKLGDGGLFSLNFITSLVNCTLLRVLAVARNRFGGKLPHSVANLSTSLNRLIVGGNLIHGTVPVGIGNLVNLASVGLEQNHFSGSIPDDIGKLQQLKALYFNLNEFSGTIPASLGNLTELTRLFMEENRLEGNIPPSLGNCQNLLILNLSRNNLNGTIPKELVSLSSLSISLAMAHNSLTGSLPLEVSRLKNLKELYISENRLSGEIPSTLSSCLSLEILLMGGNFLQGTIPKSLESLRGLGEIDLSRNNLSGQLPKFLGKFSSLNRLNLSFNNFEGEVPREGVFTNASAVSVLGNAKLCGGAPDLYLTACSREKSRSSRKLVPLIVTIGIIFASVLFSVVACYIIRNTRKIDLSASSTKEWQLGISYLDLFKSTNGFSADNLIGSGSFGSVYKGVLYGDGSTVAVKVLNLQQQGAVKSFRDECEALRSIRHRNLLKILSACSSVDHEGNDFKCLVFEFMSNGNLDQWLHRIDDEQHRSKSLNIIQRLNIAIDVACALDYLHHHCETPIVHCDLKPSNILLDDDVTAHVGDFGLAKFLFQSSSSSSENQMISVALKGSIGYIPPEYGMGGQVATLGDVYSYGILLLEMFTGKRPTHEMFKDGLSIYKFVAMALPEHVMDIVDPSLLLAEEEDSMDENEDNEIEEKAIFKKNDVQLNASSGIQECLASVMKIGLQCSNSLASDRMPMNTVVNKMHAIRDSFLGSGSKKGRRYK